MQFQFYEVLSLRGTCVLSRCVPFAAELKLISNLGRCPRWASHGWGVCLRCRTLGLDLRDELRSPILLKPVLLTNFPVPLAINLDITLP